MKNMSVAFIVGFIFAIGLGVSGMTKPSFVIGFLDIFGNWNLTLLFVMVGAILTHGVFYKLIRKRSRPLFDLQFHLPTRKDIDWKLLTGSAIFGIGWGIAGFCPGPAVVSLVSGAIQPVVFVISMVVGMFGYRLFSKAFKI